MSYEQLAASVDALAEANRSLTEQSLETQAGSIAASDNATAKALEAAQAALSAEDAARVATDAANIAKDSTDIMESTAAGIASGKPYFYTVSPESSQVLILWKNNAGVAEDTGKRTLSSALAENIAPEILDKSGVAPKLRNFFDKSLTVDGFSVNTVGELTAEPLYYSSMFIPVLGSKQYIFSLTVNNIAFYDFNGKFITSTGNKMGKTPFTVPADAQSLRFSQTLSTRKDKQVLLGGSSVPDGYIAFGYTDPATQDKKTHSAILSVLTDQASGPVNIFDLNKITEDTGLSPDGGTLTQAGYFVTGLIAVKPGAVYTTSRGSTPTVFYDYNKQAISSATTTSRVPFTTPVDACYLRLQAQPLTQKSSLMVVEGSTLPPVYVAYGSPTPAFVSKTAMDTARAVVSDSLPLVRNLFDSERAVRDRSISAVNGGTSAAVGYFITGKLPVTPGGTFVSTYGPNNLCFYDINGAFLSGSTAYNSYANTPVPVPESVYFIQFQSSPLTRIPALMVTSGSSVPSGYIPFGGEKSKLPWQGKGITILGDSISETAFYVPALLSGTGMGLKANHAKAGRPVREMGKTKAGVVLVASDLASTDLVSVFGGTNDYGGNRALGTLEDAFTGSTVQSFYNDVFQLLTLIYTLKPTVRVVFHTPLKRGAFENQPVYPAANSAGAKLEQYVKAIVEVCELFSVPVCNLFSVGGFNLLNLTSYTGDNLHPNPEGAALHVRPMISTINAS